MIEKSKDESFNDMETMRNSHFSAGKVVFCFFLNPASPIHWPVVCSCFDCTADLNGSDKSAGQQNLKVSAIWPFTERSTGSQDSAGYGERKGKPTAECFLKNKGGVKISDWCANYYGDPKKWMPSGRPRLSIEVSSSFFWPLN